MNNLKSLSTSHPNWEFDGDSAYVRIFNFNLSTNLFEFCLQILNLNHPTAFYLEIDEDASKKEVRILLHVQDKSAVHVSDVGALLTLIECLAEENKVKV